MSMRPDLKITRKSFLILVLIFLLSGSTLSVAYIVLEDEGITLKVEFANAYWTKDESGKVRAWSYDGRKKEMVEQSVNQERLEEWLYIHAQNEYDRHWDEDRSYQLWSVEVWDRHIGFVRGRKPLYIGPEFKFSRDEIKLINRIIEKYPALKRPEKGEMNTGEFEKNFLSVQKEVIKIFGSKYLDKDVLIYGVTDDAVLWGDKRVIAVILAVLILPFVFILLIKQIRKPPAKMGKYGSVPYVK